jgi:Flp pilus assembly protein TadG
MKIENAQPTTHARRRNHGCRKGAAVVEFAVISPLLILVLLGMIECGRMVMVQQALTTAVREGARAASMRGSSGAAKDAVEEFLVGAGVRGSRVAVKLGSNGITAHGQPITVTVSVPFAKVSWLPSPFFMKSAMMSSTATMRRETPY